jgi:hypothetical protein
MGMLDFLHELQYVWTPITKKLVNIYFMVVDGLYFSTYATFMVTYIVNQPSECGGTAVIWFLSTALVLSIAVTSLQGTISYITFIPTTRLYNKTCYIYILILLYIWGLFNVYMNECYFSDPNEIICKDIYKCKYVYLFLMINSNVYFLWINSIIIHILICSNLHFRKKEVITVVEITEFGDNTECSICLDNLQSKKVVKTPCNHVFHYDCIIEWMGVQMTCPICRESI